MAEAMHVELVSPERILYSGEAEMVVCRTVDGGEIAFLAGHAPFLGALGEGLVRIKTSSGEEVAAVHGGFVEVRDNKVTVLSDVAELASQVNVERARRAKEAAERKESDMDDTEAEAALRRANTRIAAAERGSR
ncbi:MAG: F-type H+-transporting ATPase subunit epsilon [Actinomycetota bacterium]|jgi:F-type H+-transporting ATPase subunit epsilon|nr:F-type H+-transporting ATPase subunit epsilon [Actinomycetota bacterium]MEA2972010.1 F-type H+-transporting ATPase subunit epsilon [Actinomycetota bacterium]